MPGGTAAYPSSVLMNALPAQVAGVEKIAMVSPPLQDGSLLPEVLVAAAEAGVKEIYKLGEPKLSRRWLMVPPKSLRWTRSPDRAISM